jgi:hypothetical protein
VENPRRDGTDVNGRSLVVNEAKLRPATTTATAAETAAAAETIAGSYSMAG